MGQRVSPYHQKAVLFAGAAFFGSVLPTASANAQNQAQPVSELDVGAPEVSEETNDEENAIIVTGSRLARDIDAATPNPVSVITSQEIENSGVTSIADLVNRNPALGRPFGQDTPTRSGEALGASIFNLRNLGANRSLTLVDGFRQVSGVVNSSAVDTFTIPIPLIERVEVSTGGASVAYGADAVTGVINFVLNRNFEGLSFSGQNGITTQGDGNEYLISGAYGTNFARGRGNISIAATYSQNNEVFGTDRAWARNIGAFGLNPENTGPDDGIPDQIRFPDARVNFTNQNGILLGALNGQQLTFDSSGQQVRPFDPGLNIGGGNSSGGDGFDFELIQQLRNPAERFVISGFANYDVTANHQLTLDVRYSEVKATAADQPTGDFYSFLDGEGGFFTISPDNPFLPSDPSLSALFAANPAIPVAGLTNSSVLYSRFSNDDGNRELRTDRQTIQINAGLNGRLPIGDLRYASTYQYGRTENFVESANNRVSSRYALAVDAVTDVSGVVPGNSPGDPACRATLAAFTASPSGSSNPAINDCRPLNIFGQGNSSLEARDYVGAVLTRDQTLTQHVASFDATGSLFELPAGDVDLAFGFQYRSERSSDVPEELFQSGDTFDGAATPSRGSYDVAEAYAEVSVPLLSEQPFAHELRVEGGARISEYSSIGTTFTWSAGGVYAPIEALRIRGSYSVAIRAPNIGELFRPETQAFLAVQDPCDASQITFGIDPDQRAANCQSLVGAGFTDPAVGQTKGGVLSGNPDLSEETSTSFTAGFVFAPKNFGNLVLNVDYYDIRIEDAVAQQSAQGILNGCVDNFETTDNEFCDLVTRSPATGQITNIQVSSLNVASLESRGIDFAANMRFPIPSFGETSSLGLNLQGTHLLALETVSGIGATPVDSAGSPDVPTWRINGTATLNVDKFSLAWTTRWTNSVAIAAGVTDEAFSPARLGGGAFHDVQARFNLDRGIQFYVGANNIFEREPDDTFSRFPLLSGDIIGRFVYAGFRADF